MSYANTRTLSHLCSFFRSHDILVAFQRYYLLCWEGKRIHRAHYKAMQFSISNAEGKVKRHQIKYVRAWYSVNICLLSWLHLSSLYRKDANALSIYKKSTG